MGHWPEIGNRFNSQDGNMSSVHEDTDFVVGRGAAEVMDVGVKVAVKVEVKVVVEIEVEVALVEVALQACMS